MLFQIAVPYHAPNRAVAGVLDFKVNPTIEGIVRPEEREKMSIYDLPSQPSNESPPPAADKTEATTPHSVPATSEPSSPPSTGQKSSQKQPKRRRFGCGGCMLGCLGMMVTVLLVAGIGGFFVWKQIPTWTRTAVVSAIEESNLTDEEKQELVAQVDRLVNGYRQGRITLEQLVGVAEEMARSPLFTMMLAYAAHERYVQPSGLSSEEKEQADRTLHRLAWGVFEQRIEKKALDSPLDYISVADSNGNRQLKESVSDEQLREMLTKCEQLADTAGVSRVTRRIDIGDELRRVVDEALSEKG